MLTIRLQRVGRKNDPSFRVILVESKRSAKTGNYQEMLGSYDARTDRVDLKADRIKHWISMGTTVSDTVHNMLISLGFLKGKKINILPAYKAPAEAAAAEVEAEAAKAAEHEAKEKAKAEHDAQVKAEAEAKAAEPTPEPGAAAAEASGEDVAKEEEKSPPAGGDTPAA